MQTDIYLLTVVGTGQCDNYNLKWYHYCAVFRSRVRVRSRVRNRFSVWLVNCHAHVFVLVSIVSVTLLVYDWIQKCVFCVCLLLFL